MSESKTEKPTTKKKKDAAQKGQSFKSKDFVMSCLILLGVSYLVKYSEVTEIMALWREIIENNFVTDIKKFIMSVVMSWLDIFLPFWLLCLAASALPTLLQTGFMVATKILKLNFKALNPANGLKKIFGLRTVKDFVKSTMYLGSFIIAAILFWNENKKIVFSLVWSHPTQIFPVWGKLLSSLTYFCLSCMIIVIIMDALAEYFLHIRDLKMNKQEVKRENKDQEGDPSLKSKRKELRMELLSEQVKSDIENSRVIVANPTHIAIGIFLNIEIVPAPFISVLEINQKAQAVRAYAKKVGVPIVENIMLARRIYSKHKRYSFVNIEELDEVIAILIWLEQVENAWKNEHVTLWQEK